MTHLPPVPSSQSRTWSIAAFAADAAEDSPRASMIAAPRLPHRRDEGVAVPALVGHDFRGRLPGDGREPIVGIHRGRVIAPDDHLLDRVDRLAGLGGELGKRAVVVEAQHRREALARQARRALHRDVGIGVGGIADHEHLDVAARRRVERLALCGEDLRVGREQILALHPRPARTRADEQCDSGVLERGVRIRMRAHSREQRERAVVEFHHHALERLLRFLVGDLEQLQDDRLVGAEHLAAGDPEEQAVADLAGGAGHGHANGGFRHR